MTGIFPDQYLALGGDEVGFVFISDVLALQTVWLAN
jgi:hypothetical protein